MEDLSRCFPVPPLPSLTASSAALENRRLLFRQVSQELATQCWNHYENSNHSSSDHHHHRHNHHHQNHHGRNHRHAKSIYIGSLGTCAYVRYHVAKSLTSHNENNDKKLQLLMDGLREIDTVLNLYPQPSSLSSSSGSSQQPHHQSMKISFLEGERVGALALKAAILYHHIQKSTPPSSENSTQQYNIQLHLAKSQLLEIGTNMVLQHLPRGECEVLYGRAGFLQAIAFIRRETEDTSYASTLVNEICKTILEEGTRLAKRRGINLPYLWEWYDELYLGAAHGFVGILYTLLCFPEEVFSITAVEGHDRPVLEQVRDMIWKLDDMCFDSGNLKPSLDDCEESDRLVHFCHGAPGHILLLVKAHEVYEDVRFLERAEEIARKVLCRRGLIRKGVGLCHGIAGNAYCFLSLYRGRLLQESREIQSGAEHIHSTTDSSIKSGEWLRWANHFAYFAIDHFNDLRGVPDHPFSLYEGAAGLIMLLHDLGNDPTKSRFPCFEIR